MRVRALGTLELVADDDGAGPAAPLRSPKLRRLLAALLVQANAVVSVDRIADVVWEDAPPASVEGAVHQLVSRLRTTLRGAGAGGDDGVALLTNAPGYLLRVPPAAFDVSCFEDLVAQARATASHAERAIDAARLLDQALGLWRGAAYAEFADAEFARAESIRLEELRLAAAEERVEVELIRGAHDEAVGQAETLVAAQPLRERPRAQLMRALYRAGRQAEALAAYREHRERLDDELGLVPSPALQQLEAAILRQDSALDWVAPTPRTAARPSSQSTPEATPAGQTATGNLPAVAPRLVGREEALAQVVADLRAARLVTLTGPGGVGKTSLALRAAADVAGDGSFPDGAWLVELAALTDPATVVEVVATTLSVQQRHGRSPTARLAEYLRPKRLLLVIDNCEHVVEATARLVQPVLESSPGVTVLATSREPLGLGAERIRPIPPLGVPATSALDAVSAARTPAVELFVERASAAAPGFALTDENTPGVAEICRRLDGLPLAIELAATRVRAMTPAEVAGRLSSRFRFLRSGARIAAERHRTLRALVEWSYELLDEDEQRVFCRLGVFAGGFDLAAAEHVGAGDGVDPDDVAPLLASLVDKSMVVANPTGAATRYALLETLRDFGRERLESSGQADTARRAHAAYYTAFAVEAADSLAGPSQVRWADALTLELDELRAAHAWAVTRDHSLAITLVAALFRYVEHRMLPEVGAWAEQTVVAVQAAGTGPARSGAAPRVDSPDLPRLYAVAAGGARFRGDFERAKHLAEQGLTLTDHDDPARREVLYISGEVALFEGRLDDTKRSAEHVERLAGAAGDTALEAFGVFNQVLACAYAGETARAEELADHAQDLAQRSGDPAAIAWARYCAGEARLESAPGPAAMLLEDALARARAIDERYLTGVALVSVASLRGRQPNPEQALPWFRDVIEHWHRAGDWTHQWTTVRNVVELLVRVGADEPAATLYGAVTSRASAAPVFGADAQRLEEARGALAGRLGRAQFAEAAARGEAMTDDAAVGFACGALTLDEGAIATRVVGRQPGNGGL